MSDKKDKPKKEKTPESKSKGDSAVEDSDFSHLVRISGVVVDGGLPLSKALSKIKGIGRRLAETLIESLKLDGSIKVGTMKEDEINSLEEKLEKIQDLVPTYMVNRKKDMATGSDIHKLGPELDIQIREDINLQKKIRSYRGVRHQLNLRVRGQKTKSTGRKGTTMGVSRKKNAQQAKK